ncbi:hypothetical protein GQ44DRAFT_762127 [Phaeosphaeriaceae sp. PMI808]|nr:hypothetical protein GQ44DRAFT_762127 [Phaeosphaeriaceae sp. PMI808]
MRFFALNATFILGAAAFPADKVARDGPPTVLSSIQQEFNHAPVSGGAKPFTVAALAKREVAVKAKSLDKREDLAIEVWQDSDQHGRHESFYIRINRCYNLSNGWEDQISSLSVPNGFGCDFFRDIDCNNGDFRLNVPGGNYIANLGTYGFNDIMSSFRCYR